MRKVRSRGNVPETALSVALASHGIEFQTANDDLPGKPDYVVPPRKIAVFLDGDFWHGGQWSRRRLSALEDQFIKTASRQYWLKKIRSNFRRDCVYTAQLLDLGWTVIRIWESELKKHPERCIDMITSAIEIKAEVVTPSLLAGKKFADFFSGIGLMRMGLERCGWSTAFANDIDPLKYEMYRGQFSDAPSHFSLEDVHKLHGNKVPAIALATASFPCNDLSLAGARGGLDGKESSAYWGFIKVVNEMNDRRPPLILLENVAGFLSSNKGNDFRRALLALNELGYTVDAFFLDAIQFVPQSRLRLFVVGVRNDLKLDSLDPYEGMVISTSRPRPLCEFMLANRDLDWAVRRIPEPPVAEHSLNTIVEELAETATEWWSEARAEYLLNQMSPRHRDQIEAMKNSSDYSYGTVFRRMRNGKSMAELRTDGIAGCLRTPRGGSGRQIMVRAGKGQCRARLVTPREAARLMGAGDYRITVSQNQALFGFGDAVCVPAIEWIGTYYLDPIICDAIRGTPLKLTA
jgi:DNA (cytosine-5)-methyltransferase 1